MRYALLNPPWRFDGSIYFGCREPHLPLELGYAAALLARAGHDVLLRDASLECLTYASLRAAVDAFDPDFVVIPTAPSYLFWRCPPPELRVPQELARALGDGDFRVVLIGPHASTTPATALRKVGADVAVMGESEQVLVALGAQPLDTIEGIVHRRARSTAVRGARRSVDLDALPALTWPVQLLERHTHHHHRFDEPQHGLGAEIEASRGCPYSCSFCAKTDHRHKFRRRPLATLLAELDGLIAQGVGYVYFIDEIFLPSRPLLEALRTRDVQFGIQTRIDLWTPELLDLLGAAGCVSVEAGVESVSDAGRNLLDKRCKLTTAELTALLGRARRRIPFVQASLLDSKADTADAVAAWRDALRARGVWANEPVPMFPYPGSPDYLQRWGLPDGQAWERALDHYLAQFSSFSDIQEARPRRLESLELGAPSG